MHKRSWTLASKAFGEQADNRLIVAYEAHQDALRFLSAALGQANGIALLQGPTGSGKTTIVNEQQGWSSRDAAVALVDGAHLTPRRLVNDMLSRFGIHTASQHDEQLLQQLNRFITQQTRSRRAPVLIIDNVDRATSSALRLVNWLAALDASGKYALRIVLTGKERLSVLVRHESMRNLARRHPAACTLNPLTAQESAIYLRTRLIAAGGETSEKVFPIDVCEKLHELSSGWPGALNERAIEALERRAELQSAKPIPRIIVTRDGETMAELELTERQYVIGRTELADIILKDSYVSKMHAMLKIYANAVLLLDLNSTNGTTVNSNVVQKTILRNNDIISLGRYRLKLENAPAISKEMDERIKASDTQTLETLDDLRRARARRTVTALKHKQPAG
ncbi:MAG: FHA domain-containing protein [Gammaproteobacteria bacterium]|nr:FHA domain-containing protein [Gammaproteobacteria bacterium]MDH3409408.1 FHA domain-containing protein [Gammaproteobacteria bacterium]MDH3552536.1 FHA domain-containing protein [Gammaproteobacteria bacterium]